MRGPAPAHPCHRPQPPGPRRRAMVSIDGTSLYHEARAAGIIYQATLRRELHHSLGWNGSRRPIHGDGRNRRGRPGHHHRVVAALHPATGMGRPQPAGRRRPLTAAQLAAAQKATRPAKPEELAWARWWSSGAPMRAACTWTAQPSTRRARRGAPQRAPHWTGRARRLRPRRSTRPRSPAPTWSRSSARNYPSTPRAPARADRAAVDEVAVRLSAPRAAHQREGHERFTLDAVLDEEAAVLDLVDARNDRASCGSPPTTPSACRRIRQRAVRKHRAAHPGWCSRCPRPPARAKPPRCAPCAPPHTAASTARAGVGADRQGRR